MAVAEARSRVRCDIDFGKAGRRATHARAPLSRPQSSQASSQASSHESGHQSGRGVVRMPFLVVDTVPPA